MFQTRFLRVQLCFLSFLFITCNENETNSNRPNILIAMADDISFPHMGAYGAKWIVSPVFDDIASKGLLFENAFTPNAKCAPSRAILLTGRNSWQLEEAANHWPYFPEKFKSIFEALEDNGYHTGYTGKGFAPGITGTKGGINRELVGKNYSFRKTVPLTAGISDIDYASNFSEFLKNKKKNQPFSFWYGSLEPHRSFEYGTGKKHLNTKFDEINQFPNYFPYSDSVKNDLLDYALEINYFDLHLGKMIKTLRDSGELDNTIIIVTADNGMAFPRAKGQAYDASNHIPLTIMWKNGIKNVGRVIKDFVSFSDFVPTILEATGISWSKSGMAELEGQSIIDMFRDSKNINHRKHILVGKERHDVGRPNDWGYPIRGIRTHKFLYLVNFESDRWPAGNPQTGYLNCDGSPTKTAILNRKKHGVNSSFWDLSFSKRQKKELYDINDDPHCLINLAGSEKYKEIEQRMHKELIARLIEQKDPRIIANGDIFDKYLYADVKHQNFYERYMNGLISSKSARWVNETDFEE